jgi:hypothetical protein
MPEREPIAAENIRAQYEDGELLTAMAGQVIPWQIARERLIAARSFWLAGVRGDPRQNGHSAGRPHIRPVLAVWVDGCLYTTSSPDAHKARSLDANPACAIATTTDGLDLVVEGDAVRVRDETRLRSVADAYAARYDWNTQVRGGALDAPYGAPTAGAPPYAVYELTPQVVYGFGTNELFAARSTRWRF